MRSGPFVAMAALFAVTAAFPDQAQPSAEKGNEVFDEQCKSCHNADSLERTVGPGLKWLFVKEKLESTGKAVNDANVLEIIDKGGKGMPAFKSGLSADDRADLLAYLKTL